MLNAQVQSDLGNQQYTLLVVDDSEMNRDILFRRLQRQGYGVQTASHGQQALETLKKRAIDLVLLDIMMPVMDGYQVLRAMKDDDALRHTPVIVVTALDQMDSAAQCIELGAEDYLPKPFNSVILNARINACLEKKRWHDQESKLRRHIQEHNERLEERVGEQVAAISQAQLSAIFAMSKLAESRDPETGEHLERLREYCRVLAKDLAYLPKYAEIITPDYVDSLCAASPLHDIGKVGVPDNILLKPGPLSDEEWEVMRLHPKIGADTLRAVEANQPNNAFIRIGIEIAECHHEKWDGSGYPSQLMGDNIPLSARILALGDVYDALRSKRPYKQPFGHEKSRSIIAEGGGRHFDPEVLKSFLQREEVFDAIWRQFKDADS